MPDAEGVQPGCTGAGDCPAPAHVHGCYADTLGHCDDPADHSAAARLLATAEPDEVAEGEWGQPVSRAEAERIRAEQPTTDDLRAALNGWDDRLDFDRWLAEHDREVAAQALRDAADVIEGKFGEGYRWFTAWLRSRADRIAAGEGS